METIEPDKNYSEKKSSQHYLEGEGEKSFLSIKQNRPLVFVLKNTNKSFAKRSKEYLEHSNYTTKIIGKSHLIGIRLDFHSLGFTLDTIIAFMASPNHKKELIEEEVLAMLQGDKGDSFLNRKDEVEILSCFFE